MVWNCIPNGMCLQICASFEAIFSSMIEVNSVVVNFIDSYFVVLVIRKVLHVGHLANNMTMIRD